MSELVELSHSSQSQSQLQSPKFKVYIGFDSSNYGQTLAYEVCRKSIIKNTKLNNLEIYPLKKKELSEKNYYYRKNDELASTEFTYTRFLAPFLSNYEGYAVFCDSDFLWRCDIAELEKYMKPELAVSCVQHDYTPTCTYKMDGLKQTIYPRKNWSSLMVFNCSHPSTKKLTLEAVNNESPAWLHRMQWANDEEIGSIPTTYNYLVGYYDFDNPKVIHYTDGGPWHRDYQNVKYGELWTEYLSGEEKDKLHRELGLV